jgi:hypothetical protein
MGRARGISQVFDFNKGWNTEASPMSFPPGTAQDLDNVILDIDGSLRRRPGVDFESDPVGFGEAITTAQTSTHAFSLHTWRDVAGTASSAFFVSQIGLSLRIHRQGGNDASQNVIGTIDMTPFATNAAEAAKSPILVSNGLGALFVTADFIEPFYIEWDGDDLTATQISPQFRDFDGTEDGTVVDAEQVQPFSGSHVYNLFNQGWDIARLNTHSTATTLTGTIGTSVTLAPAVGVSLPSNADIVYLGMKVDGSGDLIFDKTELDGQTFGNTRAPRGHFLLDLFVQDRGAASGIVGFVDKTTLGSRFTTTAFHNGRVFFAGLSESGFSNKVYFSQQLTDLSKAGKFYQEQDPTAEEFNNLLSTDGGVITIPASGKILRLVEGPRGILAFSTNGVWQIAGKEAGFDPTDVSVTQVSSIGCVGAETVVNADGLILYWSNSGIVALTPDNISGNLSDEVISKNTIQNGFLLIGGLQHKFARGQYIQAEKKVVWLYSTDSAFDGISNRFKYNGFLIFDLNLGAFYKYTISDLSSNTPFIAGIVDQEPFVSTINAEIVTVP